METRISHLTLRILLDNWFYCQTVKPGAVVLIYDDTPLITWRLAVIKDTIVGEDGLIRAASIRTSMRRTNHPITKLYPLELTAMDPSPTYTSLPKHSTQDSCPQDSVAHNSTVDVDTTFPVNRIPVRQSALRGREKI